MLALVAGPIVLVTTVVVFLMLRPRGERMHRFVGTEFEPYVAVAICAGLALGFTMSLSGILSLYS